MPSILEGDWMGEGLIRHAAHSQNRYTPKLFGEALERFRQKRDTAAEVRERVISLHAEGLTSRQIAATVDRSYRVVREILRGAGKSTAKSQNRATRR